MKKVIVLLLILLSVFTLSCSIFYEEYWDDIFLIKLLSHEDREYYNNQYKDAILLRLYSHENFDLLIPLRTIASYYDFENDKQYIDFTRDIDSLITYARLSKKKIVVFNKIGFDIDIKYRLYNSKMIELFKTGDYYIYNSQKEYFVKQIKLTDKGYYDGPLAAARKAFVFVDDLCFWKFHVIS